MEDVAGKWREGDQARFRFVSSTARTTAMTMRIATIMKKQIHLRRFLHQQLLEDDEEYAETTDRFARADRADLTAFCVSTRLLETKGQ